MTTIRSDYPEELLDPTDQTPASLERLAREALLVRLYDLGKISSGKAAELLGLTRREFLEILGSYGVSEFDDSQDVLAEAQRARAASRFQHKPVD